MAAAIHDAFIVIMCFSEAYKMSQNCRLEAENARKHEKTLLPIRVQPKYKADGWLNFIMGMDFRPDLSKLEDIDDRNDTIKQIIERIEYVANEKNISITGKNSKNSDNEIKDADKSNNETKSQLKTLNSVSNWKKEDVADWLNKNDLSDCIPLFNDYDGKSLLGLYDLFKGDRSGFQHELNELTKDKNIKLSQSNKMRLFGVLKTLLD